MSFLKRVFRRRPPAEEPVAPAADAAPFVPSFPFRDVTLSDRDLAEVNAMLDWRAGTLLGGRLLGRLNRAKRARPGAVPDRRIVWLNDRLDLRGKSVLEVGCFEGIHTAGLRLFSEDVTAVDVRPANVAKTLLRLSCHGASARVYLADVERLDERFGRFDVLFHCGVLYHLTRPVEHLFSAAGMCSHLFLDTHVAEEGDAPESAEVRGRTYRGKLRKEGGWADPFSGTAAKSFWLTESSLFSALEAAGFARREVLERRSERNGPRIALLASRADA